MSSIISANESIPRNIQPAWPTTLARTRTSPCCRSKQRTPFRSRVLNSRRPASHCHARRISSAAVHSRVPYCGGLATALGGAGWSLQPPKTGVRGQPPAQARGMRSSDNSAICKCYDLVANKMPHSPLVLLAVDLASPAGPAPSLRVRYALGAGFPCEALPLARTGHWMRRDWWSRSGSARHDAQGSQRERVGARSYGDFIVRGNGTGGM